MRILSPKKVIVENENRISAGSIVEYEQHGAAMLAAVVGEKKDKWILVNAQGTQLDLPAARLFLLPGRLPEGTEDRAGYLSSLAAEADRLAAEVKLDELWELLSEENREVSNSEAAELTLGTNSLLHHLAVRRALLGEQIYFKRKKSTFEPRPPETVESLRAQFEAERAKKREREDLINALVRRFSDPSAPLPDSVRMIERLAALGKSAEQHKEALEVADEVVKRTGMSASQKSNERAFQILVGAKHFSADENLTLFRLGRENRFPEPLLREAEALAAAAEKNRAAERIDCRGLFAVTIDNEGTLDCDDALSIEEIPGGFRIGVHISDVSSVIPPGSSMEKEAYSRATSIYTADAHIPMLPALLSEDALSLRQGVPRAAISYFVETDEQLIERKREIKPTLIEVKQRLSYNEVDAQLFDVKESTPLQQVLLRLWDATCVHEARRLQAGAMQFSRREMNAAILPDGKVKLEEASEDTPAHKLVSEMMILANETGASFGAENNLALIYRSQEPPDVNPEEQGMEILEGPARDYFRRSFLKRSLTTPSPAPHYGLGLKSYIQATSPIRRASDLINQRQLATFIRTGAPCFTAENVTELIASLEAGLDEAFQIQRERNRYFLLKYLVQEGIREIGATIMKVDGPKPLAELDIVFLMNPFHAATDMKNLELARKRRGERILLSIDSIDPRADVLVLREKGLTG